MKGANPSKIMWSFLKIAQHTESVEDIQAPGNPFAIQEQLLDINMQRSEEGSYVRLIDVCITQF